MFFLIKAKKENRKKKESMIIFQSEIVIMCGVRRAFK